MKQFNVYFSILDEMDNNFEEMWNGKAKEEIGARRRNRTMMMKKKPEFFFHRRFLLSSPFLAWLHFRTFFFFLTASLVFAHVTRERKKKNGEVTRRNKKASLWENFLSNSLTSNVLRGKDFIARITHHLLHANPTIFTQFHHDRRLKKNHQTSRNKKNSFFLFKLKKTFFFFTAPASPSQYIHTALLTRIT